MHRGPAPKYCSDGHRQAAHRARKTELDPAKLLGGFDTTKLFEGLDTAKLLGGFDHDQALRRLDTVPSSWAASTRPSSSKDSTPPSSWGGFDTTKLFEGLDTAKLLGGFDTTKLFEGLDTAQLLGGFDTTKLFEGLDTAQLLGGFDTTKLFEGLDTAKLLAEFDAAHRERDGRQEDIAISGEAALAILVVSLVVLLVRLRAVALTAVLIEECVQSSVGTLETALVVTELVARRRSCSSFRRRPAPETPRARVHGDVTQTVQTLRGR